MRRNRLCYAGYTLYAPPEHRDGIVHPTKADATEEHFDGTTTE